MMRYVVWRVARTVMPRAGLVTSVDSGSATISLGESGGTRPGDKFHVIRVAEGCGIDSNDVVQRVLPVEMIAREVSENSSVATFTDTGVEVLWSDTIEIKPGDVVRPTSSVSISTANRPVHDSAATPRRGPSVASR